MHGAGGAQRPGVVAGADGALGAHGDGDDLVDGDLPALLELHGRLDGVGVVGVQVLLPRAVHATRGRVDALGDGGIWHFFDQNADLHFGLLCLIRWFECTSWVD